MVSECKKIPEDIPARKKIMRHFFLVPFRTLAALLGVSNLVALLQDNLGELWWARLDNGLDLLSDGASGLGSQDLLLGRLVSGTNTKGKDDYNRVSIFPCAEDELKCQGRSTYRKALRVNNEL